MFYGLDLYYQFAMIDREVRHTHYAEVYDYSVTFDSDIYLKSEKKSFESGNIICRINLPIGESALNADVVDILWEKNEDDSTGPF